MKQLLQNLKNGATEIAEVPAPGAARGQVLIASRRTLVSAGTERMLVDFGRAGWIEKARQQPEKVKQVLDKIRTDGLIPTAEAVFRKLDEPMPLGYCNVGVVVEIGDGLRQAQPDIKVGDRVASNGPHAEMVSVPRNLCAKIPDGVSNEEAAFTVLGSIALQGVRLAMPALGERFVVFGLGLVGLLTVQLLRASGCAVLGVDVNAARLNLAKNFGAETVDLSTGADPVSAAMAWTGGRGVDGALLAASAKGDDIIHQAAQACRKRGRIVLVGVVDLNLRRADFYEKELIFQVSCSYGPGRYDEKYEQGGQDYPFGYVRWTEQRNFEAVLQAMRAGQLHIKELITHRITLEEAAASYDKLLHDPEALGIVIEYSPSPQPSPVEGEGVREKGDSPLLPVEGEGVYGGAAVPVVALIGAGNFSKMVLAPALAKTDAKLKYVTARANGAAAAHIARKFGFEKAKTDLDAVLADDQVNTVFIATQHDSHADLVCKALDAGKHVFVEKPLAINEQQLQIIRDSVLLLSPSLSPSPQPSPVKGEGATDNEREGAKGNGPLLMVGFNRRFSPHIVKIRELLADRAEPLTMTMTDNAGFIPPEHWTQDPERGGGRIIGEGCHFIDLLSFLAGSPVTSVSAMMVGGNGALREDKMSILLSFADGSVGAVHYFANGAKSYPKETLEIFGSGRVIRMENFRTTKGFGFKGFNAFRTWRQDKGHRAEVAAFVNAVATGGPSPIPFDQLANVTKASFVAVESARTRQTIQIQF
jgi:predicted dehydrogenase/threonine dehydrogenase-like Zn-dependent dehydrogenase